MATRQHTIDYLTDQMAPARNIRSRKMFGEYAIYCDDKVIALVCDEQLFIKPTPAGRALVPQPNEASPYPGAKPYWRIPPDQWEDHEWLGSLARITADALPAPKPKIPKR